MWRLCGRGEGCTGFLWGNLRERDHWGNPDADGRIILRWIFRKWEGVVGTGWSGLRIGTGGGHLWVRWWTLGVPKMRGISWLAAEPVSFSRRTLLHGVSKEVYKLEAVHSCDALKLTHQTQPNDTLEVRSFVFTAVKNPNSQLCTLWFWCCVGIISYVGLCILFIFSQQLFFQTISTLYRNFCRIDFIFCFYAGMPGSCCHILWESKRKLY